MISTRIIRYVIKEATLFICGIVKSRKNIVRKNTFYELMTENTSSTSNFIENICFSDHVRNLFFTWNCVFPQKN